MPSRASRRPSTVWREVELRKATGETQKLRRLSIEQGLDGFGLKSPTTARPAAPQITPRTGARLPASPSDRRSRRVELQIADDDRVFECLRHHGTSL